MCSLWKQQLQTVIFWQNQMHETNSSEHIYLQRNVKFIYNRILVKSFEYNIAAKRKTKQLMLKLTQFHFTIKCPPCLCKTRKHAKSQQIKKQCKQLKDVITKTTVCNKKKKEMEEK